MLVAFSEWRKKLLQKCRTIYYWFKANSALSRGEHETAANYFSLISNFKNRAYYQVNLLWAIALFLSEKKSESAEVATRCIAINRKVHSEMDALYMELYAKKLIYLCGQLSVDNFPKESFRHPDKKVVSSEIMRMFPAFDDNEP